MDWLPMLLIITAAGCGVAVFILSYLSQRENQDSFFTKSWDIRDKIAMILFIIAIILFVGAILAKAYLH